MKKLKGVWKRFAAMTMAAMLLTGSVPETAFAAGTPGTDDLTWSGEVNYNADETIAGEVDLTDDTTLTVGSGATLTINGGISCGSYKLTVKGDGTVQAFGIAGSGNPTISGTLIIDGGNLEAYGSAGSTSESNMCSNGAAGIDTGIYDGSVTLKSGTLTVTGGNGVGDGEAGAGIQSPVTMSGGTLKATGGNCSATYSGYKGGDGISGPVKMSGGTLTATGGNDANNTGGYGISGSVEMQEGTLTATGGTGKNGSSQNGAGISGKITLYGGTLTANGAEDTGNTEGYGADGISVPENEKIAIYGGKLIANGGASSKGVGGTGLYGFGVSIEMQGGELEAAGGSGGDDGGDGIRLDSGSNISLNGGTLTATGGNSTGSGTGCSGGRGIYAHGILLNDGTLKAAGGNSTGSGSDGFYGIEADSVSLNGGTMEATGGNGTSGSGGYGLFSGTVSLNGGKLKATGGNSAECARVYGSISIADGCGYTIEDGDGTVYTDANKDALLGDSALSALNGKMLSPSPTPVKVQNGEEASFATDLASAISSAQSGSIITLLDEMKIDAALVIPQEKTVTLDLNGHTILYNGTENASVIRIEGGNLTLKDSGAKTTRYVTLTNGRATTVADSGTASETCLAVKGGFIAGGNNSYNGGGVYVGENSTFTMEDGVIVGCISGADGYGGGVYVDDNGMFIMEDGSIIGCRASYGGGGVNVNSGATFTMEGGVINGCTTSQYGGAVFVGGTFTMEGGVINGCTTSQYGGGVCVDGTFNMNGGSITGCSADLDGGGVCVGGTFNMNGGSITGCNTNISGGGVSVFGTFNISGTPKIKDNWLNGTLENGIYVKGDSGTANNVELSSDHFITVTGALTDSAEIWVTADTGTTVAQGGRLTDSGTDYTIQPTDAGYFKSDIDGKLVAVVGDSNNLKFDYIVAKVGDTMYNNLTGAISAALDNGTITLLADVTTDSRLTIPVDSNVTLDLNDHYILYKGTELSEVIRVDGSLTLTDSTTEEKRSTRYVSLDQNYRGTGLLTDITGKTEGKDYLKVKGGFIAGACYYGGITVTEGYSYAGKFMMHAGTICANFGGHLGGGVWASGTFIMEGGAIRCNQGRYGGGVQVSRTFDESENRFTMKGGEISGNISTNGGGVYVEPNATFTMEGGEIKGNTASENGSAVFVGGTFNISGTPVIKDNWQNGTLENGIYVKGDSGTANNVELSSDHFITVTGALTDGTKNAEIWVAADKGMTVAQKGDNYSALTDDDAACFHSDDTSLATALDDGKVLFRQSLTDAMISAITDQTYTGSAIEPEIAVKDGETTLTKDEDYTVTYANNINAALSTDENAPKVIVTGKGSYVGKVEKTFSITPKTVTGNENVTVTLSGSGFQYDGSVHKPTVTVKDGEMTLAQGTDYTVAFKNSVGSAVTNPTDTDTYTVNVTFQGNYTGSKSQTYVIRSVSFDDSSFVYIEFGIKLEVSSVPALSESATYQWYYGESKNFTPGVDGTLIDGATGKSYTIAPPVQQYDYVKCVVTDDGVSYITNATKDGVRKVSGPAAPYHVSVNIENGDVGDTWFRVSSPTGNKYEYCIDDSLDDDSTWQGSNTFEGLTPGTEYKVYAREKETATHEAGDSAYTHVTTLGASITGSARYGETLTAELSGTNAYVTSRQWYVGNSAGFSPGDATKINGATGETYTLTTADIGKYIKVVIIEGQTGSNLASTAVGPVTAWTATLSEVNGGSAAISPEVVKKDDTVIVTMHPDLGFMASGVTVKKTGDAATTVTASVDGSDANKYTYTQPAYDVTVTPVFEKCPYTVAAPSAADHGSLALAGVTRAEDDPASPVNGKYYMGDTVKFSVTPEAMYDLSELKIWYSDGAPNCFTLSNGITRDQDGKYQFTMPAGNVSKIEGSFARYMEPPSAKTLTYDGTAQELVDAGTVTVGKGTMFYAVTGSKVTVAPDFDGNSSSADRKWKTTVPTAKDAGTYSVWYMVVGNENYKDYKPSDPIAVSIAKKKATVTVAAQPKSYDRTAEAALTVSVDGVCTGDEIVITGLTGTFESVEAGDGKTVTVDQSSMKVYGAENYELSTIPATVSAAIDKRSLDDGEVKVLPVSDQNYTGSKITPKPVVKCLGVTLVENEDYTLDYENNTEVNTEVGEASVIVTGTGSCTGTITQKFEIVQPAFGTVTVTKPADIHYGYALGDAPVVTAKDASEQAIDLTEETVTVYYSSSSVGEGVVWDASKTDLNAGIYYIWATVAEKAGAGGHAAAKSALVSFEVKKVHYDTPAESLLPDQQEASYDVTIALPNHTSNMEYEYAIADSSAVADEDLKWFVLPPLTDGKFTTTGLNAGTSYVFKLRRKADANHDASPAISKTFATPAKVMLSYDPNGGSGKVPEPKTYDAGSTADAIDQGTNLSRYGYTFSKWNTKADGTGTAVDPGKTDYTVSVTTVLYAQWTTNYYTVVFDANADDAVGTMSSQGFAYDEIAKALTENGFTRSGKIFAGWATSPDGDVVYKDKQEVRGLAGNGTITLYAVWTDASWTVSGQVLEGESETDGTPVYGVKVELKRGKTVFGTAQTTDVHGRYSFTGVPAGTYNVVVTRDLGNSKTQTVTKLIEVMANQGSDPFNVDTIVLPYESINSEVKVEDYTPAVMVGGMDDVAAENAEEGREVTVTMTVQTKSEEQAEGADEIRQVAEAETTGDKEVEIEYLDISIVKKTEEQGQQAVTVPVTETSRVVELIIPFRFTGRKNVHLLRFHEGAAMAFGKLISRPSNPSDGTCFEDRVNSRIYVYSSLFSTFALSYESSSQYVVTFRKNDGTDAQVTQEIEVSTMPVSLKANEFTRNGYSFNGWNTEANGQGISYSDKQNVTLTDDLVLYAQWKKNNPGGGGTGGGGGGGTPVTVTCTVRFDMNGKTVADAPATQSVAQGGTAARPAKDPEAEGFKFDGWYREAACENLFDFSTPITADTVVYAKWIEKKAETFTVSFDLNGKPGTAPAAQTVEKDGFAKEPAAPEAEGYRFAGWYSEATCENLFDFSTPITADTIIYAKWIDEKAEFFTVTFDLNGKPGTTPSAQTVEKDRFAKEPAVPEADGFTFTGWFTDAACKTKYDFSTPVTADLTLYAGWKAVEPEPVVFDEGDSWNLYEDASEHEFAIRGISVTDTVANSNAKSKVYYDAKITGSTITVKVTGDRKKAALAANTILEFDLGSAGVVEYALPVSYVKPVFKLSSTTATIKSGKETTLKTTVLAKSANGSFAPYDMTDVQVSGTGLGSVTKGEDGSIEIRTSTAGKGKISIVKDAWDGAKAVDLAYTVKGSKKDVLSVDLQGLKTVVVNSNAKGQAFGFDVMFNGASVSSSDLLPIVDKKNTGLATISDDGKLVIAYKDGVKNGTYTVTLQSKESKDAKTNVRIRVNGKKLDKAITTRILRKYDVVTKQSMVVVPNLKDVGGRIENVSVAEAGFTAKLNAAGNIEIDYIGDTNDTESSNTSEKDDAEIANTDTANAAGNAIINEKYNVKNLNIGTLTLSLTITGIDDPVTLPLKNVRAKKTTPTAKVGIVTIPAGVTPVEGQVIGTANIVSTYKVSSGVFRIIKPVKAEIIGTPKGVTAKPNENDPSEIDIYSISKKNAQVRVKLTYAGGVTKTVTVKVKKK